MKPRILIVEDEPDLAGILSDYLQFEGLEVTIIADGLVAMNVLEETPPDLLLLDLMLPAMDGLSILQKLRISSSLPVILITAKVEEIDRLIGLEAGADDYICKPFSPREVVARVKVVLRRTMAGMLKKDLPEPMRAQITMDPASWHAQVGDMHLKLTPKEFKLLQTLMNRPGRVFSRGQLLDAISEDSLDVSERAIDSHMKNLRKKFAQALPNHEPIRSIYGVGFAFEP